MPRKRVVGWCSIEGCERPLKNLGLCQYHYNKKRIEENPRKAYSGLRGHPLYILWWQRKSDNQLCEEWLDFETFVNDVEPKPEGEYFLVRLKDELFGPNNFLWKEHLRRKPNEELKDWWARKRAARIEVNPNLESDRNIKRKFGINREQYNAKLWQQYNGCAVCGKEETSLDGKTGVRKRLAIDHNHKTGKIRDLLCWRCNTVIGKIDEDIKLLQAMIDYITKHKET